MALTWDSGAGTREADCPCNSSCGQYAEVALHGDRLDVRPYGGCGKLNPEAFRRGLEAIGPSLEAELRGLSQQASANGATRPRRAESAARVVWLTPAATIRPQPVRWLWEGRVPLGTVSLLAGRPGEGKSTLTVALASRLSRGQLEGDLFGQPAATALLSYEDHAASTIVPRLIATAADRELVHLVSATRDGADDLVSVPGDLEAVGEAVARQDVRLLVVDPLVASLSGGTVDAHRDQDVRAALSPLHKMAEMYELAVVCVMHLNKGMGTDALQRISGSVGFSGAARSVLVFGRDPAAEDADATRVLANPKANLAREASSLACRIESVEIDHDGAKIATSRLVIEGACDTHASDLLGAVSPDERSELEDAVEWLEGLLADGQWRSSSEIKAAAKQAGHSDRTTKRASQQLCVEVRSEGFPRRTDWRLAAVGPTPSGPTAADPTGPTSESRKLEGNQGGLPAQSGQDSYGGPTGWSEQAAAEFIERARSKFPGESEGAPA